MLYKVPMTFLPFTGQHFSPANQGFRPRRPCHSTRTSRRPAYSQPWMINQTVPLHQPFHRAHRQIDHNLPSALRDVVGLFDLLTGGELSGDQDYVRPPQNWEEKVKCSGFSPDEVSAKVSDGKVLINARHEEGDGGNTYVRQLRRTIVMPAGVDGDKLTINLTEDGMLTVTAPISSGDRPTNTQPTLNDGEKDEQCTTRTTEEKRPCKCDSADEKCDEQSGENSGNEVRTDQDSGDTCEMVAVESQPIKGASENTVETLTVDAGITSTDPTQGESDSNMELTESHRSANVEEKRLFQIDVDMKSYDPDRIEVKVSENTLTVMGHQKVTNNSSHRVSTKAIYQTFFIPANVNSDLLTSTLNSAGQMVISGPYVEDGEQAGKTVPLTMEQ